MPQRPFTQVTSHPGPKGPMCNNVCTPKVSRKCKPHGNGCSLERGHDSQHMCWPCRRWTINNPLESTPAMTCPTPLPEAEYRDKHRVHTQDVCWACQVGTGQPPKRCKNLPLGEVEHITWVLPCRNSRVHVQSKPRGPLCARASGEGPLYRSSDTLSVAVAWGKRLCTFCHDRLSSTMKHQLADTGLHFVPHTRLITAALAQHLSKAQEASHDGTRQ